MISVLSIWWCLCVESSLVFLEEGVCYDQCVLLAKHVCLCPASFCTPRQKLSVIPGISWLPTFALQSPIMKRTYFWVLFVESLVCLRRTVQLQLLQHYWSEHRLGLLWYWMVWTGYWTGEGNGKPLQDSCLENPMNSMKRSIPLTHKQLINFKF